MRMIEKIMRSMRDTGLLDGMSDEDCDTLATAALEGMLKHTPAMDSAGYDAYPDSVIRTGIDHLDIYRAMINAALNE